MSMAKTLDHLMSNLKTLISFNERRLNLNLDLWKDLMVDKSKDIQTLKLTSAQSSAKLLRRYMGIITWLSFKKVKSIRN